MTNFEAQPRKVHLYFENYGALNSRGKPVDNDLCRSNHGPAGLLTTPSPSQVTCKRCLQLMSQPKMQKAAKQAVQGDVRKAAPETNLQASEKARQRALGAQEALKAELAQAKDAQATDWRMDIRKQVEQADAVSTHWKGEATKLAREVETVRKLLEQAKDDVASRDCTVEHLRGQLAMLERLGTIPEAKVEMIHGYAAPIKGYM